MKRTGTVAFRDIEGGVWVFEGDDGRIYQLSGGDRSLRQNGRRIEVEGDVDNDAVTFAMVGPVLKVKRYRSL